MAEGSHALCRELPNLSLSGYWWYNFFPSTIRQVMEERLDMLLTNGQVGFFSDAYCIEWAYAKSVMVRGELARVLACKVEAGQYDEDMAVGIAGDILFETPQMLLCLSLHRRQSAWRCAASRKWTPPASIYLTGQHPIGLVPTTSKLSNYKLDNAII